jgi:PAT family acetyl-CoA transporter-like MFS transporter 1
MDSHGATAARRKSLHSSPSLKKDIPNIIFLMFLYFLQAVPLGLTGSLPYILSSRKVNYADQGTFSFVFWPFSLKLLWAPIVDSLFIKRMGRRKTWLITLQYLIGFYMIMWSGYVVDILDAEKAPGSTGIIHLFLNLENV